jgi:diaminopropionate ammonia-lyase
VQIVKNSRRGTPEAISGLSSAPFPSTDVHQVAELLKRCPVAEPTPLTDCASLGRRAKVASVAIKDERARMGLGSFKALGAAYVIARHAVEIDSASDDLSAALAGITYVTASAGNHGMSVAAGARVFGARAVIFIADTVPEGFARRLQAKGAEVVRQGRDYEASMAAAAEAAATEGWRLLSDSSWQGYFDIPYRVMEGYLVLVDEICARMPAPPTHIFVQAGVGGLAGAVAAFARAHWGNDPTIVVVEPEVAPALMESIRAGHPVTVAGPVSSMGRLDCKTPSLIALKGLARDADFFATISEEEAASAMPVLTEAGVATTPSGGAGLAGLLAVAPHRDALGIDSASRILAIVSEEPEA